MSAIPSSPPPLYGEVVATNTRGLESNNPTSRAKHRERGTMAKEDQTQSTKKSRDAVQGNKKDGMTEKRRKHAGRPKPPDLNIVTDFSKPSTKPNKLEQAAAREARTRQKVGSWSKHSGEKKPVKRDLMKGPIGSLKRGENPLSGVSPSDRFLVVGLSVPSSKLADHVSSLESTIIKPQGVQVSRTGHPLSPPTPEIVITPARAEAPPPRLHVPPAPPPPRRRATSSVYSVATQFARGVSIMGQAPHEPMPPLPSTRYNVAQPAQGVSPRRQIVSTDTVFDEDGDHDASPTRRPYSGESQVGILRRGSIDSVATRHRSRGWWNEKILSPLLQRSNTGMTKPSPTDSIQQRQSVGFGRTRSLSAGDPGLSGIHERIISPVAHPVLTPEFEEFSGLGTAAEYYEACWHDQDSPTPFFPCINHDCSAPRYLPRQQDVADGSREVEAPGVFSDDTADGNDAFYQKPANRFSAAFAEAKGGNPRPTSDITDIEEDPETTPEVQEARAAPVVKAEKTPVVAASQPPPKERGFEAVESEGVVPEPTLQHTALAPVSQNSFPKVTKNQPRGLLAASTEQLHQEEAVKPYIYSSLRRPRTPVALPLAGDQPLGRRAVETPPPKAEVDAAPTPAPAYSSARKVSNESRQIPLPNQPRDIGTPQQNDTYYINQYYGNRPREGEAEPAYPNQVFPPPPGPAFGDSHEKQGVSRSESRRPKAKRHHRTKSGEGARRKKDQKRKQRRCYLCIVLALLAMIALILSLALTLTRHHTDIPVQSNWLNLTGFPPIPTGISTIARPDVHSEISGCVQPPTMWSCAVPKEQQQALLPNDPDQPNFRLEIRFQNGTFPANETEIKPSNLKARSRFYSPHALFPRQSSLFSPNPAPPSLDDQTFLGNTTDNNTAPFAGEPTPFFISFLPTSNPAGYDNKALQTRQSSDPFPNITDPIPPPSLNPDGTAAAANLLPFPSAQPLRLYNRGRSDEHYGFYTYYDRSIFLRSTDLVNDSPNATSVSDVPADQNGGAEESAATVVCTWRQTRFLVQIWTSLQGAGPLLTPLSGDVNTTATTTFTASAAAASPMSTSSATTFSRPGSFQLPVSITLDRHGGDVHEKEIFCYRVDTTEHVALNQKKIQLEDRAFGGPGLVNPAQGVFGSVSGGIDGGEGGCGCEWRNWGS